MSSTAANEKVDFHSEIVRLWPSIKARREQCNDRITHAARKIIQGGFSREYGCPEEKEVIPSDVNHWEPPETLASNMRKRLPEA